MRVVLAASAATIFVSALVLPATAMPPTGGGAPSSGSQSDNRSGFDASAEYTKGLEALKAQRYADAKKAFKRVLDVSKDANVYLLAGLADAGLNDLKSASRHYERAVRADKKMIAAHQELAITYAKLGERAKAEAALAKLKEMSASCGTCADAQKLTDAVAAVEAALASPTQARLQSGAPLLFAGAEAGDGAYLEAVGLINEGRYEQAIASLDRARLSFGPHPDVLTYLGFANRKLKRFEVAEGYYRQALDAAPEHKAATEYYGELMVERGDMAGASKMLARLDALCTFGCAEAEELRRWIDAKRSPAS